MLGAGRRLADSLGGKAAGGRDRARPTTRCVNAAAAVADTVVVADHPLLAEYHPETLSGGAWPPSASHCSRAAVLLGNDTYSQELAPRLAHRLGGSAAGDAVDVSAERRRAARHARRLRRQGHGRDRAGAVAGRRVGASPRAWRRPTPAAGRPGEVSKLAARARTPTSA